MSIVETVRNLMRPLLDDQPPGPLHVGEVMNCWTYLTMAEEAYVYVEAALNMTEDNELRRALADCKMLEQKQIKQLKKFMINEGISLPPPPDEKPESAPAAVPLGVKMNDEDLANGLAVKSTSAIMMCAAGISGSLRQDLGIMWVEFMVEMITYGANVRAMMGRRGWLKIPPAYLPPGHPTDR